MSNYKYYCKIPEALLFEKPPALEIFLEERETPIAMPDQPDVMLVCEICGSLVPMKMEEKHTQFHAMLDLRNSLSY